MNVLVIHGPNMNLIGLRNLGADGKLTLDKINSKIRLTSREKNITAKIIQSNSESKIASYLHRNRKRFNHIIISPETWAKNGYLIMETLEIIKIPVSFIISNKDKVIFDIMDDSDTFYDQNYIDGYLNSINSL